MQLYAGMASGPPYTASMDVIRWCCRAMRCHQAAGLISVWPKFSPERVEVFLMLYSYVYDEEAVPDRMVKFYV